MASWCRKDLCLGNLLFGYRVRRMCDADISAQTLNYEALHRLGLRFVYGLGKVDQVHASGSQV